MKFYGTWEAKQKEGCEIPKGLERFKIPGLGRILQDFIQGQQKQGHDICIAGIRLCFRQICGRT
jgi:hypothetical protein